MTALTKKRAGRVPDSKITVKDLPEIRVIDREIARFKKTMPKTLCGGEDSYSAVAYRHFLFGLERAKELLLKGIGPYNGAGSGTWK